jgi:hypothetical protein
VNRRELEHIVRAACDLLGEDVVIVGGSQAALAQFPDDLPKSAILSREADVAALVDPIDEKATIINANIGEDTLFHTTHGFFAEGVSRELFIFPPGWQERAIEIDGRADRSTTGLCPEIHDLAVAKLAAGRQKDVDWIKSLLRSGHLRAALLLERVVETELPQARRDLAVGLVEQAARPGKRSRSRRRIRLLEDLLEEDVPGDTET